MLTIRRLNMDTTWALTWADRTMLIDPWLIGSEVDGFSWFNEQWHTTTPVPVDDIGAYQSIVVSQSYSDHCHKETLAALRAVPMIVTPSTVKRIRKEMPGREIRVLPELCTGQWLEEGPLQLAYLDPGRIIDPIYNGIVVRHGGEIAVYFPHGFTLTPAQLDILKQYDTQVLITSFSRFKLPAFLGGAVNPGMENAMKLVESLDPKKVVHTHDENKHARGLVKKIAKVQYPDPEQLEMSMAGRFMYLQYEPLLI
jgi:L-ascorbate metabolism protein UlaG (beta-lactamase superfamily)